MLKFVNVFCSGSLGFLMPFNFTTFQSDIDRTLKGDVPLVLRSRLKGVIIKREDAKLQQQQQLSNGSTQESTTQHRVGPEQKLNGKLTKRSALEDTEEDEEAVFGG